MKRGEHHILCRAAALVARREIEVEILRRSSGLNIRPYGAKVDKSTVELMDLLVEIMENQANAREIMTSYDEAVWKYMDANKNLIKNAPKMQIKTAGSEPDVVKISR